MAIPVAAPEHNTGEGSHGGIEGIRGAETIEERVQMLHYDRGMLGAFGGLRDHLG